MIDLYNSYLPGFGEDTFDIFHSGGVLDVKIKYHSKYTELAEVIILRFQEASSCIVLPFPGQNLFHEDIELSSLSALVQYQYSELIQKTEIYRVLGYIRKHYRIFFLSQNRALYVVASSVEVMEVK